MSATAPTPDPRVGLKSGWFNAGQAIWNLDVVSMTPPSKDFINPSTPGDDRLVNSDLAFLGNYVIQGNYSGMQIWDISTPTKPFLKAAYICPGSQSDVSVYGHLLFVSAEATSGRIDCGLEGVKDTVSAARARGIRIYDISDISHPKSLTIVQTCRGSHTNTLIADPKDPDNVYIYVSGSAPVRPANEMQGCSGGQVDQDPNTALFRIEVIQVPLAHPEQAHIVSSPRIFGGLAPAARHGDSPEDSVALDKMLAHAGYTRAMFAKLFAGGPTQCHDITAYPAVGLAGGACGGYGLLLDIHDPAHPVRISQVTDTNMAAWHSVTFNNDGSKILFSDEWGGGSQPRCRASDHHEWGADAIYTLANGTMTFQSYYKMSAPQTIYENCVAHNGSLIPIPGRDVMVQGWYQGGISVFDWTDGAHPKEVAYFDRGPLDSTKLVLARLLVGVLLQRADHRVRDRARPRHVPAEGERIDLAERDRCGQDGEAHLPQRAGTAAVHVARHVRAGPRVPRPAQSVERHRAGPVGGDRCRPPPRRTAQGHGAADCTDCPGDTARRRCPERGRCGEGTHALRGRERPGQGAGLTAPAAR